MCFPVSKFGSTIDDLNGNVERYCAMSRDTVQCREILWCVSIKVEKVFLDLFDHLDRLKLFYLLLLVGMLRQMQNEINDLKVVESNELIRASYKLSKRALIFIYYLIAKLDSINQDDFTDILLSEKQIEHIFNFDGKRRIGDKKEIFSIMDELNSAPIFWENSKDRVKVNWLSSVTHHKDLNQFRLRIDPALKPYLLHLKAHFTEFFFKYAQPMEHSCSMRLYAVFKSYHSGK